MRLGIVTFLFLILVAFTAGAALSRAIPVEAWAQRVIDLWPHADQPSAAPPPAAVAVKVVPVDVGTMTRRLTSVGSLAAEQSVVIQPEIAGKVVAIGFKEGEKVIEGQILVELDSDISAAEVARSKAQLELATSEFKRADQLASQGIGTARAKEEAASNLAIANAEAQLAQAHLAKSTIKAPFSGIVGLSDVTPGKFLAAGDAIVNLERIDPLKVDFRVPENFVKSISVGQSIEVGVDAFPDRVFVGQVYAIDPLIDVNGRAVKIRARIANSDGTLKPGLFARVTLVLNVRDNAILVPESAVTPEGNAVVIYRIEGDHARRTIVSIGQRREGKVEILTGLNPGDRIVTEGQINLYDGATVAEAP